MNVHFARSFASVAAICAALGWGSASCAPKTNGAASAKASALAELRDSGAITPDQYAQRMAQLSLGGTPQTIPVAIPLGGSRRTHAIQDPQSGMVAMQVSTPASWSFQGEAAHSSACWAPTDSVSYNAESPDHAYGVEVQGGVAYGVTNNPQLNAMAAQKGCIIFNGSAADFLARVWAPKLRPGAQIEGGGPVPASDPTLQQARQVLLARGGQGAASGRMYVDGGLLKLRYSRNGLATEEQVETLALCTHTSTPNMMGPASEVLHCTAAPIVVKRAPEGRLDSFATHSDQLVAAADNATYQEALSQRNSQQSAAEGRRLAAAGQQTLAQTAQDNQARLGSIIAQSNAAIDNIHRIGGASMAAARKNSDALHQQSQAFAQHMGDQATYDNGYGGTFTASNQYSHTYVDGRGHAYQTNSAYAPGADWSETPPH